MRASFLTLVACLCVLTWACGPGPSGRKGRPSGEGAGTAAPSGADGAVAQGEGSPPTGLWHRVKKRYRQPRLEEDIERLQTLGYVQGSVAAGPFSGVTRHDRRRSEAGLNFCNSGHESGAFLMDMEGRVLHRWAVSFEDVWPQVEGAADEFSSRFWRRARLFPNGDVLAIWDGHGIVRLDRDSRVLWKRYDGAHHDLDVAPNGDIYLLTRTAHIVPRVNPDAPVLEDFVVVLDERGHEKRRVSLLEAFERSARYRRVWSDSALREGDLFHTNAVERLDGRLAGRIPAFTAGNVLVSMRLLDAIAVVDLDRAEVVWAAKGRFRKQHDPTILRGGHLLLFDNVGYGRFSAVEEYHPASMELVWEYRGSPDAPFFSETCGVAQRLLGGNTLVTESDSGRAFEVTPDKSVVWEYFNPHRAGPRQQFVAALLEVHRLPPDFPVSWMGGPVGAGRSLPAR